MQFLIPLAGLLGLEVDVLKERARQSALFFGLVGVLGTIALVFGLMALHAWLSSEVGPIYAPLIIAGSATLLALLTWAVMAMRHRSHTHRVREHRRATDSTALLTTTALTALPLLLRHSTARKIALPLGALAAVLLLNRTEQTPDE